MHEHGKSDSPVVPAMPPNKAKAAEAAEERGLAEGNTDDPTRPGRSAGSGVPSGLDRVREVSRRDKEARFTALLHHVSLERLVMAYWALSPKASPGVDGVTWQDYGQDLVANLRDLHDRVHSGRYRARPSRRAYIPKADGRLRPLGITALEDKIVQRAVVEVLNAIYESDFLGFSYGFRPGRRQHDALDALAVGIFRKKVNWVLDADIRGYFDAIDHGWLVSFIKHRVGDSRVVRLIAFGKFALSRRRERGQGGKPETFNFLGLTHICGRSRGGKFLLRRHTERKRMTAKLHELAREMQRRRHQPIPEQGRWLNAVV